MQIYTITVAVYINNFFFSLTFQVLPLFPNGHSNPTTLSFPTAIAT